MRNWNSFTQINLQQYDIIMLNEIWQIRDFEHLSIANFKIANIYQRINSRGGGTLILIKNDIKFEKLHSPVINDIIETTSIKINNTIFTSIYRPPSGNKREFTEKLSDWIDSQNSKDIYIAGDMNLNFLGPDREHFNRILELTGLTPKITSITRISSGTCIDNILTNIEGNHKVSSICIADHQGLISNIKLQIEKLKKVETYKYREMSEKNWGTFAQKIMEINITGETINDKWTNLCDAIKSTIEISFPEKTSKYKYKFTMSQGLLKAKNKKNRLLKQYKRGEIDKSQYINYNRIYRKLIQKENDSTFEQNILKNGNDSKKKWRTLKTELKLNKNKEEVTALNINGRNLTSKKDISTAFRDHFENCATKLANEIPKGDPCVPLFNQQPEWGFHPITLAELIKTIDTLEPKTSCGFDLLSNRMLKKEKLKFSLKIIDLINETIRIGEFPDALKIARVIPLFKKGDANNPSNYRPISLLPVLSKVLEKIINKQLTKKLDDLHLIDDNQYGFRPGHSTEDAVIKFIDTIEKAKINNKHVVSIHIDVSKAFDSCDHDIIKLKLRQMGLNTTGMNLMSSYLKDRVQELWLDGVCGGRFVINIGVGQGTVLGPTIFKIYIMDMHLATSLFSLRFADDTNLVGSGNNREDTELTVNRELEKLYKWFCSNKLTLHPDKSRYITYTKDKLIQLKLGGKNMMRCGYGLQEEGVKFLGVLIDENLDWKLQVTNIKKKISKGNYLLWRYKRKLTDKMRQVIYESFIRTHITYCLTVWGAKRSQTHNDLKKQMKRIWKKIGSRQEHTNTILKKHKILKYDDELKLSEIKIIWRWEKKKIPLGLSTIITEESQQRLRNRKFKRDPKWSKDSISYRLATRALKDIKQVEIAKSKNGLKNKIKNNCLLVDYNTECRIRNCIICSRQQ
jgi:hypothetical protein